MNREEMECNRKNEELHKAIEVGNIESVKKLLVDKPPGESFSYEETSALFKAFQCNEYKIASFLIHKHAKLGKHEVRDLYSLDIDLSRINNCLLDYNRRPGKSCVYKLLSWSQSPQALEGERLGAVVSMYERFFESETIKVLMMVLEEGESLDIVYDFESEDVNGIQRLYGEESEIYGLTLSNSREVFIGAKNLLSDDPGKRAKVYGVVAEQICHLAMTVLFENYEKPYREEDSELRREFLEIIMAVKSLSDSSSNVLEIVKEVFENYRCNDWECELISRVVMTVGIHGEEKGKQMLQESSELSRLLSFYENNVVPKCRVHTDPLLNTKTHQLMEKLSRRNELISFKEKKIRPLKEGFPSFKEYLVHEKDGICVIRTNCAKMCTLHVYHELKVEFGDLLEKRCLFLAWESFENKGREIEQALKSGVWEYLVVVIKEEESNPERLRREYLDDISESKPTNLKVIIISTCSDEKSSEKAVDYKWDDLSEEFKEFRTYPYEYVFKGERHFVSRKKEDFPKLFSDKDIVKLMSGDVFVIKDGAEADTKGFLPATYIEREFQAMAVDGKIFRDLPPNCRVFLSGVRGFDLKELSIDEKVVQWIKGSEDEIRDDKSVFVFSGKATRIVESWASKKPRKEESTIWLHHDKGKLYIRDSSSCDLFKEHLKQVRITEEEMIDVVRRNRIVLISDGAGSGKSTVLSSLMRRVSKSIDSSWVSRVDLGVFSSDRLGQILLEDEEEMKSEEDLFEDMFVLLGLDSGAEKCCFIDFSQHWNCFLFLDAYDEIPAKHKEYAMRMITFLLEKTQANMIVTTRKECQKELEERLNTFSHTLVPLGDSAQVAYLGKLWKWKLKFPLGEVNQVVRKDGKAVSRKIKNVVEELRRVEDGSGAEYKELIPALEEIDTEKSLEVVRHKVEKLDLDNLAANVLSRFCIEGNDTEFMRTPIHLFMLGICLYEANFNIDIFSDTNDLYSGFIERKIQTYLEEKLGFTHEGRLKSAILNKVTKDVYRIHSRLAEEAKTAVSGLVEEDIELCTSLGMVSVHGEQVEFVHRNFAEFFKAASTRKMLK